MSAKKYTTRPAKVPVYGEVQADDAGRELVAGFSHVLFRVGTWRTYIEGRMSADGSGWFRVFRKDLRGKEQDVIKYEWQGERRAA